MGELGGEQAQLVGEVGGVGLAGRARRRPRRRRRRGRSAARSAAAPSPSRSRSARPDGATSPPSQPSDGRSGASPARPAPKRSRTWTEPRSNSVRLKVRVEPLAKRTMVTSMSSIRRRETSRPGGPSGGRSSKLTRRSARARRRRRRAGGGQPLGERRVAARDRLRRDQQQARPRAGEQRAHRRPDPLRRHQRRVALEIVEHGRRGRHHRAVVDRADQLVGADLRLDGRLALHGGGGAGPQVAELALDLGRARRRAQRVADDRERLASAPRATGVPRARPRARSSSRRCASG